ncbi:uncharacterized protein EDB93DRAFT_1334967 [Suillus bovinus]|uniref:uncharacterized protein n=1 Tax=Suillus bovinus TaxID=48563 RepID=UPI001B8603BE|nr:uncharacterized protein EDB93DRAFT_1334967 [Suillus bovinus]KAG2158077.1 hypothetical protein EDB93DRAFT_1334967 [Suillus bovinus]
MATSASLHEVVGLRNGSQIDRKNVWRYDGLQNLETLNSVRTLLQLKMASIYWMAYNYWSEANLLMLMMTVLKEFDFSAIRGIHSCVGKAFFSMINNELYDSSNGSNSDHSSSDLEITNATGKVFLQLASDLDI